MSLTSLSQNNFRARNNFGSIKPVVDMPQLIELQKESYANLLQRNVPPEERLNIGIQGVFNSVFPINDYNETAQLEFVSYSFEETKFDEDECRAKGLTFSAPMRVMMRLVVWNKDEETGAISLGYMKEQEVYFGEIPLMTTNGTFIINGSERVLVSQLHRSPGAFFEIDKSKSTTSRVQYTGRIIPYRGSWLDFEFDHKDIAYVRIDRRRKLPVTVLLRALPSADVLKYFAKGVFELPEKVKFGYDAEELLNYFYDSETIFIDGKKVFKSVNPNLLLSQEASLDVRDADSREIIIKKGRKFSRSTLRKLVNAGIEQIPIAVETIIGRFAAHDIVDENTGEVVVECNEEITEAKLEEINAHNISQFEVLYIDDLHVGPYIRNTLVIDKMDDAQEAAIEIYRRMRPGDPPTTEAANRFLYNLFFNADRYDLSRVGRLKMNHKFDLDEPLERTTLTSEDILETVKYLVDLRDGRGNIDDIDHLGNRRVRSGGELLENQFRIGLVRMERTVRERMAIQEVETMIPNDLVNSKPVNAVIREFFNSSQLSQFMDQTNPLSEITHKRRLSALGPGGLTRERAGFEVRDVHTTHYGRICPIETPEGPNIGLIMSLATYARVNEFGFIETPYRLVRTGRVSNKVVYLSALEEEEHVIAQANAPISDSGDFLHDMVTCRINGDFSMRPKEEVTLMDVSPTQLVSVASGLVPFLEHDDANRALMGSNMMRQAVPLLCSHAPLVGTGLEEKAGRDAGVVVIAKRSGIVKSVDANRIVVQVNLGDENESAAQVDIYTLEKFKRSNQNTCFNQMPLVAVGDHVDVGDILADGPSTDRGELALGQNALVAFMPWGGYNFEDSILISERMVSDDVFTSIHIEEFETQARDTKLGREEITQDIPNVGEEALKDLDESGIVRIGAEVKPGDILVGKITPKGETQLSPEEKLLRAIFGEKAGDVRDTSLRVPPGVEGTVIGARVFTRRGEELDERSKEIQRQEEMRLLKDQTDQIKIIKDSTYGNIRQLLMGSKASQGLSTAKGKVLVSKGQMLTAEALNAIPDRDLPRLKIVDGAEIMRRVDRMIDLMNREVEQVREAFKIKMNKPFQGDELQPGVIKVVKIYVAIKRRLSVGDKMAGRHGNKGVVSRVLPLEDMPYLADGTPVDIVLNPLGVPSRMNIGQLLETHMGWASRELGRQIARMLDEGVATTKLSKQVKDLYNDPKVRRKIDQSNAEELKHYISNELVDGLFVATPVFDGAPESEIKNLLTAAGLPTSGQTILFDGRTGEPFTKPVTVGIMYMLKLHHLVDDKIHARSIGPYSLVTQQPLGGKAQFGGQRLGEMEIWAMEAYGAAYFLHEFLTVKSDDVSGRTKMYEAIVKGEHDVEYGVPESFNVLVKEIQSLGLNVELIESEDPKPNR